MNLSTLLSALLMLLIVGLTANSSAQEPNAKQRQAVRTLNSKIDRAGKYYTAKKLDRSRDTINDAIEELAKLTNGVSPELIELIKPEYERLQMAHKLLTDAGETLTELPALPAAMANGMSAVSFTKSVAPILVAKCGNCHVNRNRGNFSAATFDALDKSTMLAIGLPQDSRLIEVIESGEMPKGGLTVEPAELQILKDWMQQGAKYDGTNPQQSLNEFVTTPAANNRDADQMIPAAPTGKETVSFGLHIAPILVENCAQCHMVMNNPRGNFDQGNFETLLAGGDSGAAIVPGKPKSSNLFNRIDAGEMPPTGKLDSKLIALIEIWIKEGAKFDGGDAKLATATVVAVSKAKAQTHAELANDRKTQAAKTWKLVMGRIEGVAQEGKNFLVTGSADEERLEEIEKLLEQQKPKITSALKSDSSAPLVKGNVSVFVFDKRYDFSEFGKMVEQRDFPKQINGHWNYTVTDAYATVLLTRNQSAADAEVSLTQQLAAIHVASLAPDVPRWFADGVGYWTAKKVLTKSDEVKTWDAAAAAAAATMKQPDDFVKNRMPSDQAGMVSYLFVKMLKSKGANFNLLLDKMRDGQSFESAFKQAYGMMAAEMLNQAYQRGW